MAPAGSGFLVLNNVGNQLLPGGYGADRGLCERSAGRYDEPVDVFAWCGASVLLRRGYLEDAGLLDERLFLYYEDLDLSWRGLARGWRYRYTPGAIAYHRHSATSIEGSAISTYYIERNRLLVLAKNAPAGLAARAIVRHPLITASYTRRDVISPLLYLRSPRTLIPIRRMRAFLGFLYRLPATLVDRWRLGRRRRLSARSLAAWIERSEVISNG
jgi:GT2 family glycosyltransferase